MPCGGRQLGIKGSELPHGSGHIPTGITWPSPINAVSERGAQQILDSDGYIYSRKKSSDTALTSTWRCAKYNPPTKCKCHIYLALADNSLTLGTQPHNHSADGSVPARQEVLLSLKRKAADQPLSATRYF
ncbi:hypothetical protein ACHWQZ_G011286 [Mnemiopsis leidyi]